MSSIIEGLRQTLAAHVMADDAHAWILNDGSHGIGDVHVGLDSGG